MQTNPEFGPGDDDEVMNEINMIPFIDVMLVLLIVFIITVPMIHHTINIQLPRTSNERKDVQPETLSLSIRADGSYWLDDDRVNEEELDVRLQAVAAEDPQPPLHIRGDRDVRYEYVARAMATAQRVGLHKIGFVTSLEPMTGNPP